MTVVFPYPITGAAVGEDKGRVDFNMPEPPEDVAALEAALNEMVAAGHAVTTEWITDDEMAANPGLIKSMNVKPPMGQGRVRLVRIGDIDLQPCGGTHVANTREIGPLKLGKIEKKGAINRRVDACCSPSYSIGGAKSRPPLTQSAFWPRAIATPVSAPKLRSKISP